MKTNNWKETIKLKEGIVTIDFPPVLSGPSIDALTKTLERFILELRARSINPCE